MMRKLLALAACLCAPGAAPPPRAAAAQTPKAQEIDNYIKPFADANQFSGVVLAAQDGRVIYEKAFGLANADFRVPNRPDTRFGITSITKPMTGVILNRLTAAGGGVAALHLGGVPARSSRSASAFPSRVRNNSTPLGSSSSCCLPER